MRNNSNVPFEVVDLQKDQVVGPMHATYADACAWVRQEILHGSFLVRQHVLSETEIIARTRILQEQVGRLAASLNTCAETAARSQDFHPQWEEAMRELARTLVEFHRISSSGKSTRRTALPASTQELERTVNEPADRELEGYARRAALHGSDFLDHDHTMDG